MTVIINSPRMFSQTGQRWLYRFVDRLNGQRTALAVLLSLPFAAAAGASERNVVANTVISRHDPVVQIRVPKSAQYVGTERFMLRDPKLGDFDECELFAFVEARKSKEVRKLYWVQFESYLPSHPELHHSYDSPIHAALGGMDFFVDTWVTANDSKSDPGSDTEHYYALLDARGFKRRDMMGVRFVHLTDSTKRRELMIIYREPLPAGYTPASLAKGGRDYADWASIKRGLIERGEHSTKILFPGAGGQ